MGNLIFWDRNRDGRFRWIDRDFITTRDGKKVWAGSQKIRNTLAPLGLKRACQVRHLSQASAALSLKNRPPSLASHPPEISSSPTPSGKTVEEQMLRLEIAMEMGDFGSFTKELEELQNLLKPQGISLPEELVLKMQDTTRMNFHFREAAGLLDQGFVDLAAHEVELALKYAKQLNLEFNPSELSIAIRSIPPYEISEEQIKDLFRVLETGLQEKME